MENHNETELTKNKMYLNNRKSKIKSEKAHPVTDPLRKDSLRNRRGAYHYLI